MAKKNRGRNAAIAQSSWEAEQDKLNSLPPAPGSSIPPGNFGESWHFVTQSEERAELDQLEEEIRAEEDRLRAQLEAERQEAKTAAEERAAELDKLEAELKKREEEIRAAQETQAVTTQERADEERAKAEAARLQAEEQRAKIAPAVGFGALLWLLV